MERIYTFSLKKKNKFVGIFISPTLQNLPSGILYYWVSKNIRSRQVYCSFERVESHQ